MVILLGFFFSGVSGNSVIATSGVVTFDELLIDGKSMLSIGIMIFVSSRYGASEFTQKSLKKEKKKTLWPLFMDGVQLSQG